MFTELMQKIIQIKQDLWLLPHKIRSRRRIAAYIREHQGQVRLNLGAGCSPMEGWLNGDIWPYPGTVYMDASRRLPFADGSVEFVRCEHLVEHLSYADSRRLLGECYRVLQADGILRISTPALEKLIALYWGEGQPAHAELLAHHQAYHNRPAENICAWFNDHVRLWGHQFIFDQATLTQLLKEVGFEHFVACQYGESQHPPLQGVEIHDEGVAWMRWAYVVILEAYKHG